MSDVVRLRALVDQRIETRGGASLLKQGDLFVVDADEAEDLIKRGRAEQVWPAPAEGGQ